ncbi:MAG: superoxide dismutase [Campylobacterales bacterium]|nr:superoxide dismutase [Campylobacterales bacterium]
MTHHLPELPYSKKALWPIISEETIDFHYGKHHQGYVNNLNNLIVGTPYEDMTLENIIKNSSGAVFNNAAQIYNHTFYWNCLSPSETLLSEELAKKIDATFGSFEDFKSDFIKSAVSNFGSGWTWLVCDNKGTLSILNTQNAGTPLTMGLKPLLTVDVWEHAYYIDYRNARQNYLDEIFKVINWEFVSSNI